MSPLSAPEAVASSGPQARWGGDSSPPRVGGGKRTALLTAVVMLAALFFPLTGVGSAAPAGSVSIVPPLNIDALNVCVPFVVQTDVVDALVDVEVVAEEEAGIRFCEPAGEGVINPVLIDPLTGDLGLGPVETDGGIGGEATTGEGGPEGGGIFTFGVEALTATTFTITGFGEDGLGNDDPDGSEATATAQFIAIALGGGDQEPVPGATQLVNTLDCVPETDADASGAKNTFFCRAMQGDVGVVGAEVGFDVTDGPNELEVPSTACTVTDSNGVAICEYTDSVATVTSPPGTDIILGFADLDSAAPGPEVGAPTDEIRNSFGIGLGAKRVKSRVTIRKKFRGAVRSSVAKCKKGRKVVIKKARKGRDKVIARDRANRRGKYAVRKGKARGRFYALAKRKRIRMKNGNVVVCRAGKSKTIRRR